MMTRQNDDSRSSNPMVAAMWKKMASGAIDISYACVGYTTDGKPVLSHEDLVSLLINYGFTINDVLEFLDEFAEEAAALDGQSPVVMYSVNTTKIASDIEPFSDVGRGASSPSVPRRRRGGSRGKAK